MLDVTIDFETYYDGAYSLRHMPAAQYIRDPRFRVLGAAIALPGKPARYLEPPALDRALAALPWGRIRLVAHNAGFDAAILSMHYGYRPARYACTMLQARYLIAQGAIDARTTTSLDALAPIVGMAKGNLEDATATGHLAAYATLDAEICRALHERHAPATPDAEMDYMSLHVRMAAEPVLELDQNRLSKIANSEKSLEKLFPIVRKDDTFAAALSALGVPPVYKTTAKGTYKLATAKTDNWLASLDNHANPKVRLLASVRRKASSTIERSRAQRFIDVGSPLPVPLLYYGAHTARSAGLDKLNVQNLPRKDGLRQCILAPPGHKLVIVDSAQIEVRVLAYLAEQEDLLEDFRQDRDPYVSFACNSLYQRWTYEEMTALVQSGGAAKKEGRPLSADEKQAGDDRQIAKAAVLALGFGQGVNGFVGYCEGYGIPMEEETAARIVSTYRRTYQAISGGDAPPYKSRRGYWWQCEQQVRRNGFTELPSGRKLTYPDLRVGEDGLEYRRHAIFAKAKNEGHSNLWHGKFVENCLALDTDILTSQGWVKLRNIHRDHRVWDGVEFVAHDGLLINGVRQTTDFGGVRMTSDHLVLCDGRWVKAEDADYEVATSGQGHHWGTPGVSGRRAICWLRRASVALDSALRLRRGSDRQHQPVSDGREEGVPGVFTAPTQRELARKWGHARDVGAPGILGVAQHERPLSASLASGVAQLRRAWDHGLRSVAGVVREFLGGHGADVQARAHAGSAGQQRAVLAGELPVGRSENAVAEYAVQSGGRYSAGENDRSGSIREDGDWRDHAALSCGFGLAAGAPVRPSLFYEPVGDIVNCGPRNRFMVRGSDGRPFIVHNCVQAAARDVVFHQTRRLHRQGWRVVLMVHDEAVLCVPEEQAEEALRAAEVSFGSTPPWAPGLPVKGEGSIVERYGK